MMKTKIAAAASPGSASGRMIRTTAESRLQPSVIAASSSSTEMPAKTLDVTRTTNGNARAAWAIATPYTVSSMPQRKDHGERDREDHDREGARRDDAEAERIGPAEGEACHRVAGRDTDPERDHEREQCDLDASPERTIPSESRKNCIVSVDTSRHQLLRVRVHRLFRREGGGVMK